MSDNSLEVVESNASEPVIDVKQAEEQVEVAEVEEVETEDTVEVEAEPEKKLTKAEQVKQEYEQKLTAEREKFQKRIDTKTAIEKQEREKRTQLEQELAAMRESAPTVDEAPKEADFDSFDDFLEATAEYKADKIVKEKELQQKQQQLRETQQREYERNMKEFSEKEVKFREANPEYDANAKMFGEQIEYLSQAYPNNIALGTARDMLLSSDVAPAIINTLAQDPDIAEGWASLNPVQAAREVFKLEQSLSSPVETKEEVLPKPVKTLKGNSSTSKPLNKMSGKELLKKYNIS